MSKRYLVIGLGRFGTALAKELADEGCEVAAVDANMELVEEAKEYVSFAAELDATDPEALRSIDARSCAAAIVTMGEAFEASVLCVAALKDAGVERVIARVRGETQARILRLVGASHVIEVESEIGRRLARALAADDGGTDPGGPGSLSGPL